MDNVRFVRRTRSRLLPAALSWIASAPPGMQGSMVRFAQPASQASGRMGSDQQTALIVKQANPRPLQRLHPPRAQFAQQASTAPRVPVNVQTVLRTPTRLPGVATSAIARATAATPGPTAKRAPRAPQERSRLSAALVSASNVTLDSLQQLKRPRAATALLAKLVHIRVRPPRCALRVHPALCRLWNLARARAISSKLRHLQAICAKT